MKGEVAWLSMRVPAAGGPFETDDGRLVQEIGEKVLRWPVNPAVCGLAASLPPAGVEWTQARRDQWVACLIAVLEYAFPVSDDPRKCSQSVPEAESGDGQEAEDAAP